MDILDRLVAYTNWANSVWLDFVFDHAPHDDYLRLMISHIVLAEQIWFQRVYAEPTRSDVFATLDKPDLTEIAEACCARYREQLASDLSRSIAYRKLNGEAQKSSCQDILSHLVTHGSHHRGQMAYYAARNGMNAPETSYITYTRALSSR